MPSSRILTVLALLSVSPAAAADAIKIGGDDYVGSANAVTSIPTARDLFASGFRVGVKNRVEKDAHGLGFSVSFDAPVGGDAYAAGFSVEVDQPVGDDLTASGFSVTLDKNAGVGGNARLMGGTVTVDGPIAGSLVAAAGSFTLDAPIAGDLHVSAGELSFGKDAKVDGVLTYRSAEPRDIPASVAPPDRVRYEKAVLSPGIPDLRDGMDDVTRSFWPSSVGAFFASLLGLVFLAAVAAAFLALMPGQVERLRTEAIARPWSGMAFGALGLATLIGLVPVAGMTVIGVPLIPLLLVGLVIVWLLAWMTGAYALGWRIAGAFQALDDALLTRLIVVVGGAVVLALVNFIPVLGWMINLAVTFLGLGAATALICDRLASWRKGADAGFIDSPAAAKSED